MKQAIKNLMQRLWDTFISMVSSDSSVSMGRCCTFYLVLYYTVQHAWYYHTTGQLVPPSIEATHFGLAFTPYFGNKTQAAVVEVFGGKTG